MAERFVIGHDVGTGGSKAVLMDTAGSVLATGFEPYPVYYPEPNWAEQDPEDWWRAVTACTRRLLESSGVRPDQVIGMGFAGQMVGVVPVDASGQPLRPAIIWLDSRADEQARRITRRLGGERVVTRVAAAIPSGKDVVCKIVWMKENEPAVFRDTDSFLDVTGYLVHRATGSIIIDHTGAGGTGMLTGAREWSRLLSRWIGIPIDKMPPIKSSIDIAGGLTSEAARGMGLPAGTPVIAGMADIPAAATGSGALDNGDAHINLGTSSWLCLSVSRPKNLGKHGIAAVASADPDMYIMIGESETAGACLKWFAEQFARPDEWNRSSGEMAIFKTLDESVEKVEPGSGRLIFTPWMFGERSPVGDTTLRASFVNLSLEHSRDHLLRAIYEGVAYNLRWLIDIVADAGFPCESVRAIGGGAKSDVWMQIVADVTGRRIEAVENPQEAGAVGCALAVAAALKIYDNYKQLKNVVRVRKTFEPQRELSPAYEELYRNFRRLYPGLSRVCRSLNETAGGGHQLRRKPSLPIEPGWSDDELGGGAHGL